MPRDIRLWESEAELARQQKLKRALEEEQPYNFKENRARAKQKAIQQAAAAVVDLRHEKKRKTSKSLPRGLLSLDGGSTSGDAAANANGDAAAGGRHEGSGAEREQDALEVSSVVGSTGTVSNLLRPRKAAQQSRRQHHAHTEARERGFEGAAAQSLQRPQQQQHHPNDSEEREPLPAQEHVPAPQQAMQQYTQGTEERERFKRERKERKKHRLRAIKEQREKQRLREERGIREAAARRVERAQPEQQKTPQPSGDAMPSREQRQRARQRLAHQQPPQEGSKRARKRLARAKAAAAQAE